MAINYLSICCIASFGIVFFGIFEKLLQATGRSLYSTIAQIVGAVLNMILDPIMIYGLYGCPEFGVEGAAYATVIGQMASFLLALLFHLLLNKEVSNGLTYCKPSGKIIAEIYSIGLPAIIAQAVMSVMTYGLNIIFGKIDASVVTAYGLYYKVQQFVLFGLSGTTQDLCIGAMRIVSVSFIFAGINIALQGVFQALESGMESLIISLCHQLLFVLPIAFIFSLLARQSMDYMWLVWSTFIIAEGVSAAIAYFFLNKVKHKKIALLKN